MRLHRFYINEQIGNKEVKIADRDLLHQWKDVFRLNIGSQVILFNGDGKEYRCALSSMDYYDIRAEILEISANIIVQKKIIHIYPSLIKKDNLEWVFEKCTEIGVLHFHPVVSDRSEKKQLNVERAQKIITEAVEQSGRGIKPILHELVPLEEALEKLNCKGFVLNIAGTPLSNIIDKNSNEEIALFVGPEGGWSDRDLNFFKNKNIEAVSLCEATLRAETANIVASSLLLL